MQKVWTTDTVHERDRLSYWVDAVCDTYVQLDCDALKGAQAFRGRINVDQLATLGLSRVNSAAQLVRRTPAKIARDTQDYFLVSIQTAGRGFVRQDGRVAELRTGDFALYDSTRPYELVFDDDFEQIVMQMPRAGLRSRLRGTDAMTARTVHGARGCGHLMIRMIDALTEDIGALEPGSRAAVAESVENILVAGLSTLPGTPEPLLSGTAAYTRDRIKAYVLERLRDPELSVAAIAAHLRLSPSSVHRAFAAEPTSLTAWIWNQRLDGARRDLCDAAQARRGVSEIAFAWGFNDAAHFSRAFRARFGCAPRELRGRGGA